MTCALQPPQGFNAGDQFFSYLKDSFDTLYAEGGRMMSIGLHCRLIGRPGRAAALQRFIEYAQGHEGVWFATREAIADHWTQTHPHQRQNAPQQPVPRGVSRRPMAEYLSIPPGSQSARTGWNLAPCMTLRQDYTTPYAVPSAQPAQTCAWAC